MKTPPPARIHLLPAKSAPYVVVIRRKPTRWFHVLRWNTETDLIEQGSWFKGTLYPERADVSFDGHWMVYLALGADMDAWTGLCHPPWLKTVIEVSNFGTRFGGGYWETENLLKENGGPYSHWPDIRKVTEALLPFRIEPHPAESQPGDWGGMLYARLRRDGWTRCSGSSGRDIRPGGRDDAAAEAGEVWQCRPTGDHPFLRMQHIGYDPCRPFPFRFRLDEYPGLIPDKADWACWDALGQLIFANRGALYRYTREAIAAKIPASTIDLEPLAPPNLFDDAVAEG